jgi:hypothetical protein
MHTINLNSFSYEESALKGDIILLKMSNSQHISSVAVVHPGGGLCLSTLLSPKVGNSL